MIDILFGELLLLLVFLFISLRTFYYYDGQYDTFVLLLPFSIIIFVLLVMANGLDLNILVLFAILILIFLTNFTSLLSYFNHGRVDYYNSVFKLVSLFEACIVLVAGVFFGLFRPISAPKAIFGESKYELHQERFDFIGSFATGFEKKIESYEVANASVFVTYPTVKITDEKHKIQHEDFPVVLYLPDVFVSYEDCIPVIEAIAHKGFIVVSADFYTKDLVYLPDWKNKSKFRNFIMRYKELKHKNEYLELKDTIIENKAVELKELVELWKRVSYPIVEERQPVYIVADGNIRSSAEKYANEQDAFVKDIFPINTPDNPIENYIDGYGSFSVRHVFESFVKGVPRDSKWENPIKIANLVKNMFAPEEGESEDDDSFDEEKSSVGEVKNENK